VAIAINTRTRSEPALSDINRRELYFFNLFRVLQATVIAGLVFSPLVITWVVLDHPLLARVTALIYLLLAGYALLQTERWRNNLQFKVAAALTLHPPPSPCCCW
jgi:two-component system sensor histidine kinase PilS (NtrC family)